MDFDFNWILLPVTLIFFFIWLLDKFFFKQRKSLAVKRQILIEAEKKVELAEQQLTQAKNQSAENVVTQAQDVLSQARIQLVQAQTSVNEHKEFWLVRYSYDFWPVLMVVLVLRSFFFEPFNIPSESMNPTLETGDFILVQKFAYGLRVPLLNSKIIETGEPKHGDVIVFRYPENPKISYIKRVIGLPGDKVVFQNGVLTINGVKQPTQFTQKVELPVTVSDGSQQQKIIVDAQQWQSTLGEHQFLAQYISLEQTLTDAINYVQNVQLQTSLGLSLTQNFSVEVPQGNYFVMGDNRDQSADSRYWGFVPEQNLVGKAVYLWMHKDPGLNLPRFNRNGMIP